MSSRAPVRPDVQKLHQQYGDESALYADVRADVAEALGDKEDAEEWDRVKDQVEKRLPDKD